MRASPQYSKDFVLVQTTKEGEFNMAESSICVSCVDCPYERGLEEARQNRTTGVSSGDNMKD